MINKQIGNIRERTSFWGYFKGQSTDYIINYASGKVAREGKGLNFFYLTYNTQVIVIPTTSRDANFIFNEVTNNFQSVTIQGQFTYYINNPKQTSSLLNFTINPHSYSYMSDDPEKLQQRISNVIQMETRTEIQKRSLEESLRQYQDIAKTVFKRIQEEKLLENLGVEIMSIYFLSAKPTPEVGKALEAEYRESLLRKADEAIYKRRAAAVEEERKIKENELNTQITLEEQKKQLIELEGKNEIQKSEYKARATEMEINVYKELEARTLLALALKEMAGNASKIGNLTITSEILSSLLEK